MFDEMRREERSFFTDLGLFVGRTEAREIARAVAQTAEMHEPADGQFRKDLW